MAIGNHGQVNAIPAIYGDTSPPIRPQVEQAPTQAVLADVGNNSVINEEKKIQHNFPIAALKLLLLSSRRNTREGSLYRVDHKVVRLGAKKNLFL
jgi:hypothetical protein